MPLFSHAANAGRVARHTPAESAENHSATGTSGVKPPGPLRHATGSYPDHETATGDISRNLNRPMRVGRRIGAGTVWTNTWGVIHDQMEEGGFKHSGVGRLNGHRAIEEFQEIKHIVHQGN
ncbi:aldehyde dehydrogenase family protein [Nocardia abscessus]|uniref:aldehyde dehydrogenase family protein n=1 Tax=Nocardia abscessus TaxID=120957 RepID=UPI002453EA90|nr:aldehyde dehydrogenase family protein [Nocardia abscessus]